MSGFFVIPDTPDWKPRYSAHSPAYAFAAAEHPAFHSLELIAGLPGYKVSLPGGSTAQTDGPWPVVEDGPA